MKKGTELVAYEYGAMSSKYRIFAENKLTAYVTMVLHFDRSNHLVAIYAPKSSKEDQWLSITGSVSARLDEIFGGVGTFDKYVDEHTDEIRACYKTIEQLV